MNQQTCNPAWLDAFLKNDLNESEEQMLTSHLDECSDCREELESLAAEQSVWREASSMLGGNILLSTAAISDVRSGTVRSPQIELVLKQLAPTDDPESLGRIGGYEVTGVVGAGGMGVVLKAHDRSLDRIVAIKVMSPHLASSGSARRRFAREAKAAAAVLHPNVIAIHSVASEDANPFLVMPYVRGASLQKRIDSQGPLPLKDTLRIGAQIAAGLAAAHEQGLVHRDIKPANILLEEGVERVTITDFGLARAVDDASMTCSGVIAGTPQYMSPEQTRGEPIDARSDLFSLGSVLYAMCAGRSPFRAETTYGVLHRIANDNPTPVCEVNSDVPEWLGHIIERLMAKRPEDRFETAAQVAELLEGCLAHVQQPAAIPLPVGVQALAAQSQSLSTESLQANRLKAIHQRIPPRAKFIAAAAFACSLMFAGILIVLELGKGTLTIESELDDVPICIMQGDEVVKSLTVSKEGATTRIGAGKYIVEIGQEFDKAVIKDSGVELSRGTTAIVKVTQTNTNTAADEKAKDEAAKAWLRRPVVGSFHDGKSFQLAGHDALMHCVMTNNSEALNRLLTVDKYDLDFSPRDGQWTLLQTALQRSCLETTSLLLQHGANPNFASKGTPQPLELAKRSGRKQLVALVQKYLESVPPVIQTVQLDENAKDLLLRLKGEWKLDAMSFDGRKLGETRSNVTLRLTDHSLAKFDGSRPLGPVYEVTDMNAQTDPAEISLTRELKGQVGTLESLLRLKNGVLTLATPIYPQDSRPQSLEPARGVKVERWTRMSEEAQDRVQTSSTEVVLGEGPDIAELQEVADGSRAPSISNKFIQQSRENLVQISLAFHNYHEEHGHLPGFASVDGNGSPMLSWRVHLLPYMGDETKALHSEFRLNETWDSPHNRKLIARMPSVYSVPLADPLAIGQTCYVVPRSVLTLFPDHARGIDFSDIYQGLPNIALVVEGDRDVATVWTKPTDLPFDRKTPLAHLGNLRDGGFLVSWASGKVSFLPNSVAAHHQDRTEFLRGLFEQVGGRGVEYYLDLPLAVEPHNNDGVSSTDLTQEQPQPANPQADAESNRARTLAPNQEQVIAKGIAFLKAKQHDDGSWEGTPVDGVTGLAAAALLQAGVKADDPTIMKALTYLRKVDPEMTYTVAVQTIVFCAASPQEDAALIRRNVAWLEKAQIAEGDSQGSWSYGTNRGSGGDGSCTRFALLGLDAARKAGFDVQETTWQLVSDYLLTHQNKDGGWSYVPGDKTTLTMTLAGVSGLATANRHLPRNEQSTSREAAIRKSEKLIEMSMREFAGEKFVFYAIHCLERAGHLSDITRFGELDWKEFVSRQLLSTQKTNSFYGLWRSPNATECDVIATSFALLTLCGQPELKPIAQDRGSFVIVPLKAEWVPEEWLKRNMGRRHLTIVADGIIQDEAKPNVVNRVQRGILHDCRLESYEKMSRDGVEYWNARLFVPRKPMYSIGALWFKDAIDTYRIGDRHTPVPSSDLTQDNPQVKLDEAIKEGHVFRLDYVNDDFENNLPMEKSQNAESTSIQETVDSLVTTTFTGTTDGASITASGIGWRVDDAGHILLPSHVVPTCQDEAIELRYASGVRCSATRLKTLGHLTLLKSDQVVKGQAISLDSATPLDSGDAVSAILNGTDNVLGSIVKPRTTIAYSELGGVKVNPELRLQNIITTDFVADDTTLSGAPLLTKDGDVAGMIIRLGSAQLNAIPVAEIREVLKQLQQVANSELIGTWRPHPSIENTWHSEDVRKLHELDHRQSNPHIDKWTLSFSADGAAKFTGIEHYLGAGPESPPMTLDTWLTREFDFQGKWDLRDGMLSIITDEPAVKQWKLIALTESQLVLHHETGILKVVDGKQVPETVDVVWVKQTVKSEPIISDAAVTVPPMEFDTLEDFLKPGRELFDKEMKQIDERLAKVVEGSAEHSLLTTKKKQLQQQWDLGVAQVKGMAAAAKAGKPVQLAPIVIPNNSRPWQAPMPDPLLGHDEDIAKVLAGTWQVKRYVADGEVAPLDGATVTFSKNMWIMHLKLGDEEGDIKQVYRIGNDKIDIWDTDSGPDIRTALPYLGSYSLENDTLRICYHGRAMELETPQSRPPVQPGKGFIYLELQRAPIAEKVSVAKGETDDLRSGQSYKIKPIVLASDDLKPVAGAMVDVTLIRSDNVVTGDGGFASFKTDEDGIATIDKSLWPGRYQVQVRAPEGSRYRDTEFTKEETILVVHEDGRYSPREFRLAVKDEQQAESDSVKPAPNADQKYKYPPDAIPPFVSYVVRGPEDFMERIEASKGLSSAHRRLSPNAELVFDALVKKSQEMKRMVTVHEFAEALKNPPKPLTLDDYNFLYFLVGQAQQPRFDRYELSSQLTKKTDDISRFSVDYKTESLLDDQVVETGEYQVAIDGKKLYEKTKTQSNNGKPKEEILSFDGEVVRLSNQLRESDVPQANGHYANVAIQNSNDWFFRDGNPVRIMRLFDLKKRFSCNGKEESLAESVRQVVWEVPIKIDGRETFAIGPLHDLHYIAPGLSYAIIRSERLRYGFNAELCRIEEAKGYSLTEMSEFECPAKHDICLPRVITRHETISDKRYTFKTVIDKWEINEDVYRTQDNSNEIRDR